MDVQAPVSNEQLLIRVAQTLYALAVRSDGFGELFLSGAMGCFHLLQHGLNKPLQLLSQITITGCSYTLLQHITRLF